MSPPKLAHSAKGCLCGKSKSPPVQAENKNLAPLSQKLANLGKKFIFSFSMNTVKKKTVIFPSRSMKLKQLPLTPRPLLFITLYQPSISPKLDIDVPNIYEFMILHID